MSRVVASLLAIAVAAATAVALPASAQAAVEPEIELVAPDGYYPGDRVAIEANASLPVEGKAKLERRSPGGEWTVSGVDARFADGRAVMGVKPKNVRQYRVSIAGATSNIATLEPLDDGVALSAPETFLAGESVMLTADRGRHANGVGSLAMNTGDGWEPADESVIFVNGTAAIAVAPTEDIKYRVAYDGFDSNIVELTVAAGTPAEADAATEVVVSGDGDFRDGEWELLVANLDSPLDGPGSVWVRPDGGSWTETDDVAHFVDGEAAVAVLPTEPAEYRIDFDGLEGNAVEYVAAAVGNVLSGPETFVRGEWVTLTLNTNSFANGKGRLYERPIGGEWRRKDIRPIIVDGIAETVIKPKKTRQYRARFGGKYSNVITIKREFVVVSLSAPESYAEGTSVEMSAALSADASGVGTLQVRKVGRKWSKVSDVLFEAGVAEFEASPTGTREYRVKFGKAKSNVVRLAPGGVPASFTFDGSGWGHGVGMPQYGGKAMAVGGATAEEILEYYYTGSDVETLEVDLPGKTDPDGDEKVAVQVYGSYSDRSNSVRVKIRTGSSGDGQWRALFYDANDDPIMDGGSQRSLTGDKDTRIDFSRSGSTITATAGSASASGKSIELQWEGTTYYQSGSSENAYADILTTDGNQATHGDYRHGQFDISVASSRINITNELKFNTEYLYGIAEVPSSWPDEMLQAQAIAARNYAGSKRSRSSSCDCHLYDDTRSQYFSGWKKENEAGYGDDWVAAVDATTSNGGADGRFLTYGSGGLNNLVRAYYFSSSGGQTENSEDIWVATLSYTRSVADPYSVSTAAGNPNKSWGKTVSQSTAASVFGLPDVASIEIVRRTSGAGTAAVDKLRATSSTGETSSITGPESIRIKFGLKSSWIWSIDANA